LSNHGGMSSFCVSSCPAGRERQRGRTGRLLAHTHTSNLPVRFAGPVEAEAVGRGRAASHEPLCSRLVGATRGCQRPPFFGLWRDVGTYSRWTWPASQDASGVGVVVFVSALQSTSTPPPPIVDLAPPSSMPSRLLWRWALASIVYSCIALGSLRTPPPRIPEPAPRTCAIRLCTHYVL